MAYVLNNEATYSFSYQITSGTKVLNRSLAGLNSSDSGTGKDIDNVFASAETFFNLIYSPTGFSSISSYTPKAVTKKINIGLE